MTFRKSLDLIPNGVLLINNDSHKVAFANKEMLGIIGAKVVQELENKMCEFKMQDLES